LALQDVQPSGAVLAMIPLQKLLAHWRSVDSKPESDLIVDGPLAGLPRHHFQTILADPPWSWNSWSKTNQDRATFNQYDVMTLEGIKSLPIADLAAYDCALFLWSINSMLPQALSVMDAWGFSFKTVAFTWAKRTPTDTTWHIGLGFWTRQNSEHCLLGTRGKPKRVHRDVRELVIAPRRQHSRKPDEVAAGIERLVIGPYLELFARERRAGWAAWGNEIGKFQREIA
jgi:N6-adenosine-specific RNA methylase IME4